MYNAHESLFSLKKIFELFDDNNFLETRVVFHMNLWAFVFVFYRDLVLD